MQYRTGQEYSQANPDEVREFLAGRHIRKYTLPPERLHVVNDGRELFLRVSNGRTAEYPVRGAFLFKLLKWFGFPSRQIDRLSIDTVTSVLNDYLVAIPGGDVNVTVEDGEALALTSSRYNELSDLEVLDGAGGVGIASVSRNDYFMRVYSRTDYEVEPVPGDICGIGCNFFNSETGFRSLSVRLFIRRYVCSNGAVVGLASGGERIHYGHPDMELGRFLQEQIRIVALAHEDVGRLVIRSAQLSAGPELERIASRLRPLVGRRRAEELIGDLGDDPTVYELANAVTSMARSLDIRKRLQAESIGGDLLAPLSGAIALPEEEFHNELIGG